MSPLLKPAPALHGRGVDGAAILDRITALTMLADDEVQKSPITSGFEPILDSGPEQASRMASDELARWEPIIKATGFKME